MLRLGLPYCSKFHHKNYVAKWRERGGETRGGADAVKLSTYHVDLYFKRISQDMLSMEKFIKADLPLYHVTDDIKYLNPLGLSRLEHSLQGSSLYRIL